MSGGVFPQRLLESLQSSPLKTRSKRAVKVDASFYLEAASGHFLFGEDDSSAAATDRRSAYGGMADFGDEGTGRLATSRGRDLWGTERLRFEKDQIYQILFSK